MFSHVEYYERTTIIFFLKQLVHLIPNIFLQWIRQNINGFRQPG